MVKFSLDTKNYSDISEAYHKDYIIILVVFQENAEQPKEQCRQVAATLNKIKTFHRLGRDAHCT